MNKNTDINSISISEKLQKINDHWHPHILAELNGQHVKIAKVKGEFVWHKHDNEDEMFMVISGELIMELRDKTITLQPNEIIVIPRGVEHKPVAHEETAILLFEPDTTLNTGNIINDLTRHNLNKI